MNKEDKELLLKDLCARLPYGVKIHKALYGATTLNERDIESFRKGFDDILVPYLRPLDSMTDEEGIEICRFMKNYGSLYGIDKCTVFCGEITDWLNAHHFDYRNLIERDLALEAPKDMYYV